MKKIEEKKANKDQQHGEKVQKKINRARSADNQEELNSGRKPKKVIDKEQLIQENLDILVPLTEEEMEAEKHKTYLQKIQRKHYKLKTEKKLNENIDTQQQQPLRFQSKTCNKQFYSLLKRIKSQDLDMASVDILYGYLRENYADSITQDEKDWYIAKRPHLRKYVQKEKDLRAKRQMGGNKKFNQGVQVRSQKRQRLSDSWIEEKKISSSPAVSQKQSNGVEVVESENSQDENISEEAIPPVSMAISLEPSEHQYEVNPDEKIPEQQQSKPLSQTITEPVNESELIDDINSIVAKGSILGASQGGRITSERGKLSPNQNTIEPTVLPPQEEEKQIPREQQLVIMSDEEYDKSVEIIEFPPSKIFDKPQQIESRMSRNPTKVRASRQIMTRGIRSLQDSINSLNPHSNSRSASKQRVYGPQNQPQQNPQLKLTSFAKPSKIEQKSLVEEHLKPTQIHKNPTFKQPDPSDNPIDIAEMYKEALLLYSKVGLKPLETPAATPQEEELKTSKSSNFCLPLKELSKSKDNFLTLGQLEEIIRICQGGFFRNYTKAGVSANVDHLYNLNDKSIFLNISSGCGVSCLHVQSRVNCLTYGISESLDSINGSIWLRDHLENKLKKPPQNSKYTFNKTQFIYGRFEDLTHFGVGDYIQHPATHILITKTNNDPDTCRHIVRILRNSSFRILIWPFDKDKTFQLLGIDGNIEPTQLQLAGGIKAKEYFTNPHENNLSLYIYYRIFTPEVLATLNPQEQVEEMIKYECRKISDHMTKIRQNMPLVPTWQHSQSGKKWIKWRLAQVYQLYQTMVPTAVDPILQLANQVAKAKPPELRIHQQPPSVKTTVQENAEHQIYLAIIKELETMDNGCDDDIQFPYKIIRLLYASMQSLIIEAESDLVDKWVLKASTKAKGSHQSMKNELEMAKFMCSKSTSNRILRYRNSIHIDLELSQKEKKAGVVPQRLIIIYDCYPFNLYDLMLKRFFKEITAIRYVFAGIALGVMEFHKNGLAHCDLKPTNILIDKNMRPIVGDYGLTTKACTNNFALRGTPSYMPVEYFTQQLIMTMNYDYRKADIWNLGVLLFEMIYGRKPFKMLMVGADNKMVKLNLSTDEVPLVFKHDFIPKEVPDILMDPRQPNHLKNAINLIQSMLLLNPDERININFVLGHPFISDLVKNYEKTPLHSDAKIKFNELYLRYLSQYGSKLKATTEKKKSLSTTPVRTRRGNEL